MNRSQLENLYRVNGLDNYRLSNTEELLRVHGVDYRHVKGYGSLDDINKLLYKKFIINYYNAFGLDTRATLIPMAIYYVEDTAFYIIEKEDDGQEIRVLAGGLVKVIDRDGKKRVLTEWQDQDYEGIQKESGPCEYYLRFEYKIHGRREWMHVRGEKSWH